MQSRSLVKSYEQEKTQHLQRIEPLIRQRQNLQCNLEIVALQLRLVSEYCCQPIYSRNIQQLKLQYTTALTELYNELVEGYKELLKCRNDIYDEDKKQLVDLNKENRNDYLTLYQQQLQKDLPIHEFDSIDETTILELKESLKLQLLSIESTLGNMDPFYTEITDEWLEREKPLLYNIHKIRFAEQGHGPLQIACMLDSLPVIRQLVKNKEISKTINKLDNCGQSALHLACLRGDWQIIDFLFKQGANPLVTDSEGYPIIKYAVQMPHLHNQKILQLLLAANPKAIQATGPYARTGLHFAAFYGNLPAMKWLMHNGLHMSLNEQEQGESPNRTPLQTAVCGGHYKMVNYLLRKGANPLIGNRNKESALFEAIYYGHRKIVKLLMEHGANFTKEDLVHVKRLNTIYPSIIEVVVELLEQQLRFAKQELGHCVSVSKQKENSSSTKDALLQQGLFADKDAVNWLDKASKAIAAGLMTEQARTWLTGGYHEEGRAQVSYINDKTISICLDGIDINTVKKQILTEFNEIVKQAVGDEFFITSSYIELDDQIYLQIVLTDVTITQLLVSQLKAIGFSLTETGLKLVK